MANINSFRAIQLLDLVDDNGYIKTYNSLTNSNDLLFVNSLSASTSYQLVQTTGLVNYTYYQIGLTYSF